MAKMTATRPSQILGLRNSWIAYQFDNGVVTFGRVTESKLSERDKNGKPKHRLDRLLADRPDTRDGPPKISVGQLMALGIEPRLPKD